MRRGHEIGLQSNPFYVPGSLMFGLEGGIMGEQLLLERFFWFDTKAKKNTFPNVSHHLVNYISTWHLIAFCRMYKDWRR